MEEIGFSGKKDLVGEDSPANISDQPQSQVAWRDLREWIDLIEGRGFLKRISAPVDTDEELSAVTFMATRSESAPALLFENLKGGDTGTSVLTNMLGASIGRYALAMGLDEKLSTRDMIAATRRIMKRRIAPKMIPKNAAPVNEVVQTGADIDITRFRLPNSGRATAGAISAPAT
jgi:4-hydroxy-3-polyprenylbenzoate decarboxylase